MNKFDDHNTWFLEEHEACSDDVSPRDEAWHERIDLMSPSPLQLTVSWRAHILSLTTLHNPRTITIGSAPESDVVLEHDAFGRHDTWQLPLLSTQDGEWVLHVHPALPTTFHHAHHEICLQHIFTERLLCEGVLTLSLARLIEEQGQFHVRAGELDLLIERVARSPRAPLHAPLDAATLPYLGLSTALHTALMLMILTLPAGIDQLQEEFESPESPRFVRAMVVSPELPPLIEQPQQDAPEQYDLQGDGDDAALGAQHKGIEGKAGRVTPTDHTRRLSVKKRAHDERRERVSADKRERIVPILPSDSGALAVLMGKSDLLGASTMTQGDATRDHVGNLRHKARGDSSGSFGIGIVGVGKGGGATHESVGITMDRAMHRIKLGGQGVAQRKEKRGEKLDDLFLKYNKDAPATRGCLSEDMIKRAIRRRRNQIRTCYEHHLLKDRDLAGRVAIELTIGQSGDTTHIEVIEDTTGQPAIGECVMHKLDDLSFPAFSQCESVVARYPFNFHPKQLMVLP